MFKTVGFHEYPLSKTQFEKVIQWRDAEGMVTTTTTTAAVAMETMNRAQKWFCIIL